MVTFLVLVVAIKEVTVHEWSLRVHPRVVAASDEVKCSLVMVSWRESDFAIAIKEVLSVISASNLQRHGIWTKCPCEDCSGSPQ